MSIIRADSIKNRAGDGAPDFPNGITVTGIVTATTLNSVTNNVDVDDFISVGNNIHLGNAGVCTATSFVGSGANLTSIPAGNLTGTVADARISTLTASKLTGALPAISGANLTGVDASQIVQWTYHNTSTGYSRSNTASWQDFTEWRVNITPTSTSNRIVLIASVHLESRFSSTGGSGTVMQWQVSTDGGSSYVDIDNGNVGGRGWSGLSNKRIGSLCTLVSLDIPNNTNAHKYRMRGRTGGYSNTESWFGNSCDASWWGSGSGNTNSWFYAIEFKPNV